jgi:hypothetical protein
VIQLRSLFLIALGAAIACTVVAGGAGASSASSAAAGAVQHGGPGGGLGGGPGGGGRGGGYGGYFVIRCAFSHRNDDDAIVFPGVPGKSHNHTYFGNRTTNASSTPESLRASGQTTCQIPADTAAYWVPTLVVNGQAVEPFAAAAYYVRRTNGRVQPFPVGLKMIAGSSAARIPQSLDITSWSCGRGGPAPSSTIPTCTPGANTGLRLRVNFPNCWDGQNLDSSTHQSHMAYSANGACPADHPVAVPALTLIVGYSVAGGPSAELSSQTQFSGHGDFVNGWNQDVLSRLVDRYLNGGRFR